jgi:uncharacterized protein (DUF2249 family)
MAVSITVLTSSAADREALEAIERQHARLVGGLSARIGALLATARDGGGWQAHRDALVTWYRAVLVPHAEAEEAVLYPAARKSEQLGPLIRAMSHEQALLGSVIARLQSAPDGSTALMHAGAAQTLFETHVAKENDLLLPAVAAAPGTSLAQLLSDMRTMLGPHDESTAVARSAPSAGNQPAEPERPDGHTCRCHDDPDGSPELDARTIPHAIRHATIFGALDAVGPTAGLILLAPHDPLPLLDQIEQRSPEAFDVEYLQRGPEAWRLRFTRTAAEPVAR